MTRILILLLFCVVGASKLLAQSGIGLYTHELLNSASGKNENKIIQLYLEGDSYLMISSLRSKKITVRKSFGNYVLVRIPMSELTEVSQLPGVSRLIYNPRPGVVLNDSARVHSRVDQVHAGIPPLLSSHSGSGVILGIIDTGIDYSHPDFRNDDGSSRILFFWNQNTIGGNPPTGFGYGDEFSRQQIENGTAINTSTSDHGSHVTGIAAGNARANAKNGGVAPKSDIIFVSYYTGSLFDFTSTVADAVEYIFNKADSLGKPCVINTSVGTYSGSHDGGDPGAQMIDNLIRSKSGRIVVGAAGNSGDADPYHLGYEVSADTAFTWFDVSPVFFSSSSTNAVYFEIWSESNEFDNLKIAIGANLSSGDFSFRGRTEFWSGAQLQIASIFDTIRNSAGDVLATVQIYSQWTEGSKRYTEVLLMEPDSSDYYFSLMTVGLGKIDIWSGPLTGTSPMVSENLPDVQVMPEIAHYRYPDQNSTLVSSWQCLESVITVGNYVNQSAYTDYIGNTQTSGLASGAINPNSSAGPTRDGRIKPDISAPGTSVFSCAFLSNLAIDKVNNPSYVAPGGFHKINSGTSMASPHVAGIAALYLERCPNASWSDFRTALISSANQETLPLPDNHRGYGKVDAYGILSSPAQPNLSVSDTAVCREVTIGVNALGSSYQWSNGEPTSEIIVTGAGNYFVLLNDSLGCRVSSDTASVQIDPYILDPDTISVSGTTTFCEGDEPILTMPPGYTTYQWNNGLPAANLTPLSSGFYFGTLTDATGCKALTDTLTIIRYVNPPKPTIAQSGNQLTSSVGNTYQWYLNGIAITDSNAQSILISDTGYYQVETINANGCGSLSDSILAMPLSTAPMFSSGRDWALYPNPSHGKITIDGRFDGAELIVNDAGGQIVYRAILRGDLAAIDLTRLPPGSYPLQLITSESISRKKLILLD